MAEYRAIAPESAGGYTPTSAAGRHLLMHPEPRNEIEAAKLRLAELAHRRTPMTQTIHLAQKYPAYAIGGTVVAGLLLVQTGLGRKLLKYGAVWAAQAAGLQFVAQLLNDDRRRERVPPPPD